MKNLQTQFSDKLKVASAKMGGGGDNKDIDIAVVKATTSQHHVAPKEKHVRTLKLAAQSQRQGYVVQELTKRLRDSTDWLTVLKTLVTIHRLMRECGPARGGGGYGPPGADPYAAPGGVSGSPHRGGAFGSGSPHAQGGSPHAQGGGPQHHHGGHHGTPGGYAGGGGHGYGGSLLEQLLRAGQAATGGKGGSLLGVANFIDTTNAEGRFDFSEWVRAYGKYLDEQLEVYGALGWYIEQEQAGAESRMRTLTGKDLLFQLPYLQRLQRRLLDCVPKGQAAHDPVVLFSLLIVVKESFKLYKAISEGIINLADAFFEMEYVDAVRGLEAYRESIASNEALSRYFAMIEQIEEVRRSMQLPKLAAPPTDFTASMEAYLADAPRQVDVSAKPAGAGAAGAGAAVPGAKRGAPLRKGRLAAHQAAAAPVRPLAVDGSAAADSGLLLRAPSGGGGSAMASPTAGSPATVAVAAAPAAAEAPPVDAGPVPAPAPAPAPAKSPLDLLLELEVPPPPESSIPVQQPWGPSGMPVQQPFEAAPPQAQQQPYGQQQPWGGGPVQQPQQAWSVTPPAHPQGGAPVPLQPYGTAPAAPATSGNPFGF